MARITGRSVELSLPRRFICDLVQASRHVPAVTFERRIDLSAVLEARHRLAAPPPWAVLFAKAFGMVARHRPELRRTYVPLPRPRLWEADDSTAAIAVEREYRGEAGVFFGMLRSPESQALTELAETVRAWKTQPVEAIAPFQRALRYTRLPFTLRRLLWWTALSWSGKVKARNFGTFGVSLTGAAGATATNLIGPVTTSFNCGVFRSDGTVDLRLHFDHRVYDGMTAARALADLEDVLTHDLVLELESLAERESNMLDKRLSMSAAGV